MHHLNFVNAPMNANKAMRYQLLCQLELMYIHFNFITLLEPSKKAFVFQCTSCDTFYLQPFGNKTETGSK